MPGRSRKSATTAAALLPPPPRMTYEEYLEWLDEDTFAEWVDGEVGFMSPVTGEHQDLLGFLYALFRFVVESRQSGAIRTEPFQMKTGPDLPGRSPDILFLARENAGREKPTFLDGPADLVVEIVGPDSRTRDRKTKRAEYERGGVREYWIVDPRRDQAEFLALNPEGRYQALPIETGIVRSVVLDGLWLDVGWLWQEPLPPLVGVLRDWMLI